MNSRIPFFFLLIILFILNLVPSNAQINDKGNPLMVAYDYALTGGSEWNYSILKDDRGIMYFGNEIQGVLEYDGTNWNSIQINDNPVIYGLAKDGNGVIYACGPQEFGYIAPGESDILEYVSLSSRLDSLSKSRLRDVFDVKYFKEDIYFVTKRRIYKYNYRTDSLSTLIINDRFFTMQRLFVVGDRLVAADNREGLTVMDGDSLQLLPGGEKFGRDYCFTVLPYDDDWFIVGTYLNGLHLYNSSTGEVKNDFVSAEHNEILKSSQIYNGSVLSDGNLAIGTMQGGVYIFNRNGKLIEHYSNETLGLHNKSTYSMYHDGFPSYSSHLWLSVVEKIYRIAYNLPIRYFDERNNITSPIRQITEFNDKVYVGGDMGVARMDFVGEKVTFTELEENTNNQTYLLVTFDPTDGKSYLLAATIDNLFIIDENENVQNFLDILTNPEAESDAGPIHSLIQSEFYDGVFYVGHNQKLQVIKYSNGKWEYYYSEKGFPGKVQYLVEESPTKLWVSTIDMDKLFTLNISESDTIKTEYTGPEIEGLEIQSIKKIDGSIVLVTDASIFRYNPELEKFEEEEKFLLKDNANIIYEDIVALGEHGYFVSAFDERNIDYLVRPDSSKLIDIFYLLPRSYTARLMFKDDMLWLPKQQEIYLMDLNRLDEYEYENDVLIREVIIGGDSILFNGVFYELGGDGKLERLLKHQSKAQIHKINHSLNDITFHWSSNNYLEGEEAIYSFMIEGFDKVWSRWESVNYKDYTNLQHGKYKFLIKAKGKAGIETEVTVYEFEIARAWYQSVIAMIIYAILIVLVIVGIIKVYTRRLINENVRLEGIVADRTREVVRQKEELEASIHYASRIQRAILPSEKALVDKVEEYFILFRPRDIVSGDFYWVSEKGSRLYIVAADCTGHGVPGAFMSILGISFLDEIVNKAENTDTDKILNTLRKHVTDSLKQMEEGTEETKDGMDLGILVVNYEENEIEFSGAYNPCWVVRELTAEEKDKYLSDKLELDRASVCNGEYILETIDADRMPIGISSRMDQSFKMHSQKLEKGVSYYLLSDGFSDQFGGENGRKFLKKNLKKLILEVQGLPMKQQRDLLEKRLLDWMGDQEQVDDILVMGIRVI